MTTWDEPKRRRNLAKHGVDLAIAERFDFDTAVIREDVSEAYGERREIAIGWIDDWLYVYIYTLRGDEDDAALIAAAEADPDNPPLTEGDWRRMRPAYLVRPELVARQLRRERGRPKSQAPKQQVTLRIDRDVLEKFRATGDGWQSRIN